MKTHSVAKALRKLADLLESTPNIEFSKLPDLFNTSENISKQEIAVNLATLHRLSQISKKDWRDFINSYDLQIKIEKRDSARNIIGKLLNHLNTNPELIESLKKKTNDPQSQNPSALSQALDILLEDL